MLRSAHGHDTAALRRSVLSDRDFDAMVAMEEGD